MKHKLQFDKLANQILNENMNSESVPDVTKIVASVGVEATEGILNDLNGLEPSTLATLQGMIDSAGEEEIGAQYTSYEEGVKEVLEYYERYNEENPEELEELKGLLQKLKEKANGKNVKWVVWGIETDVNLGFVDSKSEEKPESNSEDVPDVTKIVASVGADASEGILNDLNGLEPSTLATLQGMIDSAGEEEIGAQYTSFEEGAREVLNYYKQYNEENPEELEELKGLLQKLNSKAVAFFMNNASKYKTIRWVTWGIETDVNLGFIAH